MKPTLGLTGLTINAMALIAPGAFLWLTYQEQCLYGAPLAGCAMWCGFVAALALCFATAVSYSELSKLYPGAGSSYFFAEQTFLAKTKYARFARIAKFFTGWASHLYYWVYPGLMVGVTAILAGYLASILMPDTFSRNYNSPLFMVLFSIVFALLIGYIAYRGVNGSTAVNMAINVIQISALIVFSVIAIGYRCEHPQGSVGFHLSNGVAVNYLVAQTPQLGGNNRPIPSLDANSKPLHNPDGSPVYEMMDAQDNTGMPVPADLTGKATNAAAAAPFTVDYIGAWTKDSSGNPVFNYHDRVSSVLAPHGFSFVLVQACIAILLLVGFESVTSLGEEAKNPKKDIGRAVLLSLAIQGAVCYIIEYFAANYFLNSGYTINDAGASGAPIGDMMVLTGTWLFGSPAAGKAFMLVEAFTVFLALIGTTLACTNTGARVTYAMGRDEEVPSHFGLLHGRTLSPHRSILALTVISIIFSFVTIAIYLGGQGSDLPPLDKHNFWYSFGIFSAHSYTWLPNTLVLVTLISNFGTFLLYMTTNVIAMMAFKEHDTFSGFKHFLVPLFGLGANLLCMLFYLVGPFMVSGMSWHEPYMALGVAGIWGVYGLIYFVSSSKKKGKEILVTAAKAEARV